MSFNSKGPRRKNVIEEPCLKISSDPLLFLKTKLPKQEIQGPQQIKLGHQQNKTVGAPARLTGA